MPSVRVFIYGVYLWWGGAIGLAGGVAWAADVTNAQAAPPRSEAAPAAEQHSPAAMGEQLATLEAGTSEPETSELAAPEPETPESETSQPETSQPETSEPETSEPVKWRPLVLRSQVPPAQRPIFGAFTGTYVMVGPHLGLGLGTAGLLLGGEVSVVHQTTEFAWFGAYVDAVHDFGRDHTRFSLGPELGWSAFGLDAGYLLSNSGNDLRHGVTLRPLVSIGYVTLFGRFSKHVNVGGRVWSELGVLLKYPFEW